MPIKKQIETKLNTMRTELVTRINKIKSSKTRQGGPLEQDSKERAVSLQNVEVVDHLDDLERKELESIDAALKRVELGTYGICLKCGEDIENKRLDALPTATICMVCMKE